jgi:hypothetical protein
MSDDRHADTVVQEEQRAQTQLALGAVSTKGEGSWRASTTTS